jgi:hypothetical protein
LAIRKCPNSWKKMRTPRTTTNDNKVMPIV